MLLRDEMAQAAARLRGNRRGGQNPFPARRLAYSTRTQVYTRLSSYAPVFCQGRAGEILENQGLWIAFDLRMPEPADWQAAAGSEIRSHTTLSHMPSVYWLVLFETKGFPARM